MQSIHQRFRTSDEGAHCLLQSWTERNLPAETTHVFVRPDENTDPRTKRSNEFKLGRCVAESQLANLGHENPAGSIGVNDDRSPCWPVGFTGSISHSERWLWASVCESKFIRSIGVDTEVIASADTRRQVQSEIADEKEWGLASQMGFDPETTFTIVFSAKEAFYKCLYPLDQNYFGFEDAKVTSVSGNRIRIQKCPGATIETGQSITDLEVSCYVAHNNVFTATWVRPDEIA